MKKIISLLSVGTFSLLALGCANQSLNVKPRGEIDPKFLGDQEVPGATKEDISDAIKRSTNLMTGLISGSYLEVTPEVGAVIFAEEKEKVSNKVFKENLNEAQKLALEKEIPKKVKDATKGKRCFIVVFRTSEPNSYQNEKEWHGAVIVGDKEYPLSYSKFVGFSNTTTHVSGYGGSYSAYNTTQYTVVSSACTSTAVALNSGFKLRIEPRFKAGIKPVELVWALPGTLPKAEK